MQREQVDQSGWAKAGKETCKRRVETGGMVKAETGAKMVAKETCRGGKYIVETEETDGQQKRASKGSRRTEQTIIKASGWGG